MTDQVALHRETCSTFLACEKLLATVKTLVRDQNALPRKAFSTFFTDKRLLTSVTAFVSDQKGLLGEACLATREVAFKRLLSRVKAHVNEQGALPRKAFSTLLAYKRFLTSVSAHVIDQATSVTETFAASWVVTYVLLFLNCLSYKGWRECSHVVYVFMAAPVRR